MDTLLGATRFDLDIHKEFRVAVLLRSYTYIPFTGSGQKWKHLRVQHTQCLHHIGGESNLGIQAFLFFFIFIQHIKSIYQIKGIRIRKKYSEVKKIKIF